MLRPTTNNKEMGYYLAIALAIVVLLWVAEAARWVIGWLTGWF